MRLYKQTDEDRERDRNREHENAKRGGGQGGKSDYHLSGSHFKRCFLQSARKSRLGMLISKSFRPPSSHLNKENKQQYPKEIKNTLRKEIIRGNDYPAVSMKIKRKVKSRSLFRVHICLFLDLLFQQTMQTTR